MIHITFCNQLLNFAITLLKYYNIKSDSGQSVLQNTNMCVKLQKLTNFLTFLTDFEGKKKSIMCYNVTFTVFLCFVIENSHHNYLNYSNFYKN